MTIRYTADLIRQGNELKKTQIFCEIAPLLCGIILGLICFSESADAVNGYVYVTPCGTCKTTAQFTTQAITAATAQHQSGTYTVVSMSQPSAAYIQITGHQVLNHGSVYFEVTTTAPIDANGNSLGGESETSQEAYYAALDQTLFGANRSIPTSVNEPDEYAGSFINSDDSEVVPGIGYALLQKGINQGSIPFGTLITVHFSDGTSAQYTKASATATYQWTWNQIAYNSAGKLMYRNGTPVGNVNTAGAGGGSFNGPGFGAGSDFAFELLFQNLCTLSFSTSLDGELYDLGSFQIPC